MKRRDFLKLSAAAALTGMAAACGAAPSASASFAPAASSAASTPASSAASSAAASSGAGTGRTLVACYSATGHTAAVAGYIADATGADLFLLQPVDPYTDEELDYNDSGSRVSQEHADPSLQTVELEAVTPEGWADYDTVFVGCPIWWGRAGWPVNGFVTGNDFSGKRVIPFCTSASSGLGSSAENLAQLAGSGDWQEGMRFSASASESDVAEWLAGLAL
ncbi:MAG TPA: twin-arginine translocation signal domain-containing protein [Candidatus Faecalibacterium faecigallinarum]|uniref:Twin-arginine translocation signal domain-containing protein n=1 Tax=Candidatus Faecalibacterium faecigallinarum TaxID=2838577 RepID=A0A9D2P8Y3_9FIRM|nr:twin-arginine translocation signal domain-containing protein [Candidatus Faecalibacterium faecigallinarum]